MTIRDLKRLPVGTKIHVKAPNLEYKYLLIKRTNWIALYLGERVLVLNFLHNSVSVGLFFGGLWIMDLDFKGFHNLEFMKRGSFHEFVKRTT